MIAAVGMLAADDELMTEPLTARFTEAFRAGSCFLVRIGRRRVSASFVEGGRSVEVVNAADLRGADDELMSLALGVA